jgi:cell division protein FtsL
MPRGAAAAARRTRTGAADVQHAKPKTARRRRVSGPFKGGRAHAAEAAARDAASASRSAAAAPARRAAPARKAQPARKTASARKAVTAPKAKPGRRAPAASRPVVLRPAPAGAPLGLRVARAPFVRALRSRGGGVLDALLSGQGWIALVGLLLVGIVFFNVGLLELNRNITGTSQRVTEIKRENAKLRLDVARLGSSERIQTAAAAEGLVLPAPGDVRYLKIDPTIDARRAAKRIVAPSSVALIAPPTTSDPVLTTPPAEIAPADTTTTEPQAPPADTRAEPQAAPAPAAPGTTTAPATQTGATPTETPTG